VTDRTGHEVKRLIFNNNKLQQNLILLKKLLKKREMKLQEILNDVESLELQLAVVTVETK
jgi:hypothetical protein